MLEQIRRFLSALDEALIVLAKEGERLDLYPIGRSALTLHQYLRIAPGGTQDLDVLQLSHPLPLLQARAIELFGKGTTKARALGLYLVLVPVGLPPVPGGFARRCREIPGDWKVLRIWQLEVHDLAATKLKCFRAQDREDLQLLCDSGQLEADRLMAALELAFRWTTEKDGDPDRERAFANLQRVVDYLAGKSRTL
jgi:hypothetical protein